MPGCASSRRSSAGIPTSRFGRCCPGPDALQHVSIYCAGGKCPDVLMAWEFTYAGLAERGVLLDLNTMLARDTTFAAELRADSIASLYETFAYNGGQYAFPEQWSGNFLFYNKKLFAEAGVHPPPGRWDEPWSFGEFLDAARALTKRDGPGRVTQWGFVDTWVPYYSALMFGMNNGVPWSTPRMNPTHLNFDDDGVHRGHPVLRRSGQQAQGCAHRIGVPVDVHRRTCSPRVSAAMALGGHWRYQTLESRRQAWISTSPCCRPGPKGHAAQSNIGTTGLAIAASSPRKQQAWEFVKFAAGPVGQAVIAESGLFVPVLQSALESPGFRQGAQQDRQSWRC